MKDIVVIITVRDVKYYPYWYVDKWILAVLEDQNNIPAVPAGKLTDIVRSIDPSYDYEMLVKHNV